MAGRPRVTVTWEGDLPKLCQIKGDQLSAIVLDHLEPLANQAASYARSIAPVQTGHYRGAIIARRNVLGRRLGIDVLSQAPHAHLVETGRKPGKMPPAATIGRVFDIADRGQSYVIARRIGAKRTKGHRVMAKTKRQMKGQVAATLDSLGRELVNLDRR